MNYCDDGGACHHNCADRSGQCYRRKCCEPLSNVFPNDEWPPSTGVEVHEFDPTKPKETPTPAPTPSITVGTQVRLTGVAMSSGGDGDVVTIESDGFVFGVPVGALEVIRQPFKRGEVVQPVGEADAELWQLVGDEDVGGKVLAVPLDAEEYQHIVSLDVDDYERRP